MPYTMNDRLKQEIAQSLEVTPELLPFIPELLADIWVLGSSRRVIVESLSSFKLPSNTKVLEVGCGKGAVAITVAQKLGFQVLGIDLFEPFIQEARERSSQEGLKNLCCFEIGDMRTKLREGSSFDVVIYAAVGGILGRFDQCVKELRQAVRPSGYIVIDDGFLTKRKVLERPGYEHYTSHEETLQQLTVHGEILVREVIIPADEIKAYNRKTTDLIRQRAKELAGKYPELTDHLSGYIKQQEIECEILETMITGAVWVLQKA